MNGGAVYVRDGEGRIVWHEKWPRDLWERGPITLTTDLIDGSSSAGLEEGDVVYWREIPIWDETARRRSRERIETLEFTPPPPPSDLRGPKARPDVVVRQRHLTPPSDDPAE